MIELLEVIFEIFSAWAWDSGETADLRDVIAPTGVAQVLRRRTHPTQPILTPVELSDDMRPGVVSLPHGFGHDLPGARLSVAIERQAGVNANVLTDEEGLDVLSGNAILNGIPVELERVAP